MTLAQAYSALYYDEKIKDAVPELWKEERQRLIAGKGKDYGRTAPVWFRNKVAQDFFNEEPENVKAAVKEHRDKMSVDYDDGEMDMDQDEGVVEEEKKRRAKARSYQS
jgi:hypothetical protein